MRPKQKLKKVSISANDLIELIHWARRYADCRVTWVPNDFNKIYDRIMDEYPFMKEYEFIDESLTENGKYFPYAKDGKFLEIHEEFQSRCF